jgi:PQQ-dependent catabolism-associated CXXCW motif protein
MRARLALVLGLSAVALAAPSWPQPAAVSEPDGYRMDAYRAPTPPTLKGAQVVTTAQAEALWKEKAAFIDVLPRPPRPAKLPTGTIWHDPKRLNIPGSIWLPNTGFGALAAVSEAYLRRGLERASGGSEGKWLVIYCQRECWQSWNAAKRALAWGYRRIAWYPEGTDGWLEAGLPLEQATPAP